MEKIFIGNIMHQTTDMNVSYRGVKSVDEGIQLWYAKSDAVLYQTEDGRFIDVEELLKRPKNKTADKIERKAEKAQKTKKGLVTLPSMPKDDNNDFEGFFVDSNSLRPYNEIQNENETSKARR